MIKTIIFDLDGTLVDSLLDLANSTNLLLENNNYPTHQVEEYKQFVGNGVDKLIERALPNDYKGSLLEYRQQFDAIYSEHCLDNTTSYKGIKETISSLKNAGYNLAVVTNKPTALANKIVKTIFKDDFSYIFGNTIYQPKKPDPTLVNLALDLLETNKKEAVLIGDSDVDMLTAKNAKIKAIGCLWGFRDEQELRSSGATKIAKEAKEIMEIINDWNK